MRPFDIPSNGHSLLSSERAVARSPSKRPATHTIETTTDAPARMASHADIKLS